MSEVFRPKARVLFVVTEDWYFLSHRLPMVRAAQWAGYEVCVATQVGRGGADIERHGFVLHPQCWHRGGTNPLKMLRVLRALRRRYRQIAPNLMHHVGVQSSMIRPLVSFGSADAPAQCLDRPRLWNGRTNPRQQVVSDVLDGP